MQRKPEQIRLQNLELLIAEAGSAVKLARIAGTNSSYLSQVRNRMPTKKGTPRGIGDDVAEKLERSMNKPHGWMDEAHEGQWRASPAREYGSNVSPGPDIRGLYPLISWVQAGDWMEISEGYVPGSDTELYPCPVKCSDKSFVLRVRGISMEPEYHDGDLIFVDPCVHPVSGKSVVVMLEDSAEATFKQLIIEESRQYLKALNPEWPKRIIEVNENAHICGVVVFKGKIV